MITTEQARELLQKSFDPHLTTEHVGLIADVKPGTIRQWIHKDYLQLRGTVRPKTGKTMLFSFHDLVEILAYASLSRLGVPPNRSAGAVASVIMSQAFNYLQDIAGVWGDYSKRTEQEREYQRYVVAWYDPTYQYIEWTIDSIPRPRFKTFDGTWITLDSHLLMERAVQGLARLGEQLIRRDTQNEAEE